MIEENSLRQEIKGCKIMEENIKNKFMKIFDLLDNIDEIKLNNSNQIEVL